MNAPAETGSGQKTATGHTESDPSETTDESERDETDSGQKTAIGHAATAHGKIATETSHADDALDRLTASGK